MQRFSFPAVDSQSLSQTECKARPAILICAYGAYDAYGAYGPKTQIINFLVFSDNYRAVLNFSSHFPLTQGLPKTFQAF